ncbi:response regulator transcription factor [Ramlibacter sp. RBP-2]|uniref:Response regulator transcription factor n=2 Tax=Ramlibacter lithotrophicus TaxID=2606681 RepID=A0A7X6DJ19_9BURK|nr:response regulator transcription factor [Ramlibacter lithotrophicus]NKE68084.1 response regulator transcription factor [Ramlibacter lithotrophicus]
MLLLCDLCTDRLVTSLVANGACGSVAAASDALLWAKAVLAVHRGECWFARSAVLQALRRQLAAHHHPPSASSQEERLLTTREREILSLIGAGMSNKEIGRVLSISDQTVKTHLHHIYVKLNRSGRYKAFVATPPPIASASRSAGAHAPPS